MVPQQRDILSYCAGLFDADGCFTMWRSPNGDKRYAYVTAAATLDMREEISADIFKELFGGSKQHKIKKVVGHSDTFFWRVTGYQLEGFVEAITPYLILKRDQALLVTSFRGIRGKAGGRPYTEQETELVALHHEEMKRLNARGVGKEAKFLPASHYTACYTPT